MLNKEPRGNVGRVFANRDGELVAIITWKRGEGPGQAIGDFREGQSVTVRAGKVVAV